MGLLNKKWLLNSRGQASVTDAMFFLIIVSVISVFLLISASQYGSLVTKQLDKQYFGEYIDSSLKTILYVTVPREDGSVIGDASEMDYLITALKEDYADDGKIGDYRKLLSDTVRAVMAPQTSVFNYAFIVHIEPEPGTSGEDEFVFMQLKWTTYSYDGLEGDRYRNVTDSEIVEYYCNPESWDDFTNSFLINLGDIFQSSTTLKFPRLKEGTPTGSEFEESWPIATAYLLMWYSGEIPEPSDGRPLFVGDNSHLRCCLIGTEGCPPAPVTTP